MWQAIAGTVKGLAEGAMSGAKGLSEEKTERTGVVRGWAGPIIFMLTALPFVALLWGWFGSIFFVEAGHVSTKAIEIVKAIGPVYFFTVISILLTGTAGATAMTVNRKIESELEVKKEEHKTIQLAIEKGEGMKLRGFDLAFSETIKIEGGYVNDPDDKGGKTYKGISRVNHPNWSGWKVVDRQKAFDKKNFPECLATNLELNDHVKSFYKEQFWLKYGCDKVNELSELMACELFDSCVNSGYYGVQFLQKAINDVALSKGLPVITADGKFGNGTLQALDAILS